MEGGGRRAQKSDRAVGGVRSRCKIIPSGSERALTPYRGYYFRVLTLQGNNAPGGAKSYVANGKMTEGFAFVAYPAEYRVSGVMTFIVGSDGVVYERNLGPGTSVIAKAVQKYDPDTRWHMAEAPAK